MTPLVRLTLLAYRQILWLWALPLTLIGLPLWLGVLLLQVGSTAKKERKRSSVYVYKAQTAIVFVAYGGPLEWLLKQHPYGEMDAMAVGCCIFAQNHNAYIRTLSHELVHVQQALHWGPLFPLAYMLSSLWQKCCGRCPYADNFFEKQANYLEK
jgi:hypothetical protein